MIEIEKNDDLDIYVIALKQNAYFVEKDPIEERLNKLLYADFNRKYLEKNKENVDFLTEEAKKLQEDIQKNPTGFIEFLVSLSNY